MRTKLRSMTRPTQLGEILCVRGHVELAGGHAALAAQTLLEAEQIASGLDLAQESELRQAIAELRLALRS